MYSFANSTNYRPLTWHYRHGPRKPFGEHEGTGTGEARLPYIIVAYSTILCIIQPMKIIFTIFFALQVLLNSSVASAHLATDVHDSHEAVHVHAGSNHSDGSSAEESDHEDGAHFHLCAFALSDSFEVSPISLNSPATPFHWQRAKGGTSPPVPPPNA